MNFLNWLEIGGVLVVIYGVLAFFYVRHRSLEMLQTASEIGWQEEGQS
jgi:hypothetical protein